MAISRSRRKVLPVLSVPQLIRKRPLRFEPAFSMSGVRTMRPTRTPRSSREAIVLKDSPFEKAQGALSGALSRLMVVAERYPTLKATDSYRDLQAQIEGTENRITVARKRYIESVSAYNKVVLRFPSSIGAGWRGKKERPTLDVEEPNIDKPPAIDL